MTRFQVQKTLLVALFALLYGVVKVVLPDFPLEQNAFVMLLIYVVSKLGVEVVEARVARFLERRGLLK